MGMGVDFRYRMAKRASEEIKNGMLVNLGIGIPSLVPNHLPENMHVIFHSENGIIGMGPSPVKGEEDSNLCNAGGFPVTIQSGGSYCDSSIAFGMIRKGKVDLTILGSLQVSSKGDLANWIVPGKKVPGMGGAVELAQKAKRVVVVMNHCDKSGISKIVKECSYPLTSSKCVNLIITEMAVFKIHVEELWLTELFKGIELSDVIERTNCEFRVNEYYRSIPY
ncbi:MAG: 3-oxoacid CoA-transferase subunit B [Bacillota bacterium]|nr:3-oxoacid CoA-transferase subunit B [Bacillota bacterium]